MPFALTMQFRIQLNFLDCSLTSVACLPYNMQVFHLSCVSDFHQVSTKKNAYQAAPSITYVENIVEALQQQKM